MNVFKNVILTFSLLLLCSGKLFSQFSPDYPINRGWEVGCDLGLSYFYGDINDNKGRFWNNSPFSSFYYEQKKIAANITLGKTLFRYLSVRGHFIYGKLSGSNEILNMYFDGNIIGLDGDMTFHYLDYFMNRHENAKFNYYVFAGLGLMNFNAIRREIGSDQIISTIGYTQNGASKTEMTTESMGKLGLGIGFNINDNWQTKFETSLNYINTDKLDAYFPSDKKIEGYGFMSIGFIYKFKFQLKSKNNLLKESRGTNNKPNNSGVNNKKKRKLK